MVPREDRNFNLKSSGLKRFPHRLSGGGRFRREAGARPPHLALGGAGTGHSRFMRWLGTNPMWPKNFSNPKSFQSTLV
jgi:hypothetical protein